MRRMFGFRRYSICYAEFEHRVRTPFGSLARTDFCRANVHTDQTRLKVNILPTVDIARDICNLCVGWRGRRIREYPRHGHAAVRTLALHRRLLVNTRITAPAFQTPQTTPGH